MGSIFFHVFRERSFDELNQLDTSVMDAMGKRFEIVFPSHDVNQQKTLSDCCTLGDYFCFEIWDRLLGHHAASRSMTRIDPKICRVTLGMIVVRGSSPTIWCHLVYPWKIRWDISSHLPMSNWYRYFHPFDPWKSGEIFSSIQPLPNWVIGFPIVISYNHIKLVRVSLAYSEY